MTGDTATIFAVTSEKNKEKQTYVKDFTMIFTHNFLISSETFCDTLRIL